MIKFLPATLLLTSCAITAAAPKLPMDQYSIRIKVHDSKFSLHKACGNDKTLKACAYFRPDNLSKACSVHVMRGDYCSLQHELDHCFYGDWHKGRNDTTCGIRALGESNE